MKTPLLPLVAVCFFFAIGVPTAAQTPHHLDPTVAAIGKELPRGDVVSYDTREEAIRKVCHSSKYLQPLTGWTRSENDAAVMYKTRYKIPFEWIDREQFLHLGGVSASFDVLVNGEFVGYSQAGGSPAEFDITAVSHDGANSLEIVIYKETAAQKLENSRQASEPQIPGEVYVLSQPRIRVRDIVVDTRMNGSSGLLELGVILKSHRLNAHDYSVYWELLNPAGEIMAEGRRDARLDMRREDTVRFFANIPRVVPWSHEEPHLYTLYVKTQHEGRFGEHLSFRVGFRTIGLPDDMPSGMRPDDYSGIGGALTLNGVPLYVTMHDFSPAGDMAAMRREIGEMRSRGITGLMLRGAPPSREFYTLCDSMGVYLACRADIDTHSSDNSRRVGGNPSNDPAWEGAYLDRTMAMYHTAKNHPSVVMFSLADRSANGYNLYESYLALKAKEKHRPVIYIDGGGEWNTDIPEPFGQPPAHRTSQASGTSPSPVDISAVNVAEGRFRVENRRSITPLAGETIYKIMVGRKVVSSGSVPIEVQPGQTTDFTVPISGVKEGKRFSVSIEIAVESTDGDYLPDGDPDRRVFRRLDQPLAATSRTLLLGKQFKSEEGL